jgi:hypothetical protein
MPHIYSDDIWNRTSARVRISLGCGLLSVLQSASGVAAQCPEASIEAPIANTPESPSTGRNGLCSPYRIAQIPGGVVVAARSNDTELRRHRCFL